MAKIVLPIRGGPPPEPPYGGLGEEGWVRGLTFYDFVQGSEELRPELEGWFRDFPVPAATEQMLASYPRPVRVLALLDPQEPVSRRLVARAERLFTLSTRIWMRVFDAQSCPDLVARYAPESGSLPVLVFFGEDQREFARFHISDASTAPSRPGPAVGADLDDAMSLLHALQRILENHAVTAS